MTKTKNSDKPRRKQLPTYSSFRFRKKIKAKVYKPLPSAWALWKTSLSFLWRNKRTIAIFLAVYAVLYIVFVRGLSGGVNLGELKDSLKEDSSTVTGVLSSITLFGVLLSTSNATASESASLYQSILLILGSLAFIWLLRQLSGANAKAIRVRDSFYQGMRPLVPFLIILLVIALEFLPMSIGGFILNTISANGVAGSGAEVFAVVLVSLLLAILSLYLVSGSIAALYIVTLPNMEPVKALRASHQMLLMHRWSVIRKFLLLIGFLFISGALIFIPLLLIIPSSAAWISEYIFFACSITAFAIFHIYMYNLYKSLL